MSLFHIDLSKVDFMTGEKTKQNTANCYVIRKPGKYKFPIVYGNAIKNGEDNKEAYEGFRYNDTTIKRPIILKFSEFDTGKATISVLSSDNCIIISNLKFDFLYRNIKFKIKSRNRFGGNAIIGLKYGDDVIWCWHIWYNPLELRDLFTIKIGYHQRKKLLPEKYENAMTILSVPLGFHGDYFSCERKKEDLCYYRYGEHCIRGYSLLSYVSQKWSLERVITPIHKKLVSDPCPPGFKVPGIDLFKEIEKKLEKDKESSKLGYCIIGRPINSQYSQFQDIVFDNDTIEYWCSDKMSEYRLFINPTTIEISASNRYFTNLPIIPCVE